MITEVHFAIGERSWRPVREVLTMFCPQCGREATGSQRFCKTCGTNLFSVTQALSGFQLSTAEQARLQERIRDFNRGIKLVFTGIGLAVFFFFVSSSLKPVGIGALVLFIGLGQMVRAMVSARPRLEIQFQAPEKDVTLATAPRVRAVTQAPPTPPAVAPTPGSVTEDATLRLGSVDPYSRREGE